MRIREAHIPILLWVSAAALLHLGGGEQADKLATVHENTSRLRVAARSLADPPTVSMIVITPGSVQLNPKAAQLLRATASYTDGAIVDVTGRCDWTSSDPEVASIGTKSAWVAIPGVAYALGKLPGQVVGIKPGAATVSCSWEGAAGSASIVVGELVEVDLQHEEKPDDKPEVTPEKKPEKKEHTPEPPKVQKKEEIIVAETPPLPDQPKVVEPPPPPPDSDKKIAVQQHQDQDEKANPEAHYLAEKNHHVKPGEETQANITSTSENDKNPTPGTHQGPASEKPGNADKTKVAQDDDRKGEKVAPNVIPKGAAPNVPNPAATPPEKKVGEEKGDDKKPGNPAPAPPKPAPQPAPPANPDGKGITAPPVSPNPPTPSDNGPTPAPIAPPPAPSVIASANPPAPPGPGNAKPKALPSLPSPGGPKWVNGLGYGAKGEGGKPSISIDEKVAKAAVGQDELDRLKKVEGETKLSMHRGAWKSSSLERWRAAIENYVPGVKPGNQTNLGTAAVPWATYLAQIHVRLHPIFAEQFVDGLNDLPAGHPLNDKSLVTRMEIVMRADGSIHHLGIVKPSGVTAFDLAALDSVDRAGPFGKAPDAIVSPDGLVYLHWEFHRDDMRCSNVNAFPYVLKEGQTPKAPEPKPPGPAPKGNPEEKKAPGQLGYTKTPNPNG